MTDAELESIRERNDVSLSRCTKAGWIADFAESDRAALVVEVRHLRSLLVAAKREGAVEAWQWMAEKLWATDETTLWEFDQARDAHLRSLGGE